MEPWQFAGIDIGLRATGIAHVHLDADLRPVARCILVRTDNLLTTAEKARYRQGDQLVARVIALLDGIFAALTPDGSCGYLQGVAIEIPHGGARSATAARAMGISLAVAAEVKRLLDVPVETYAPHDVKRAVLGRLSVPTKEVTRKDGTTRKVPQTKQWIETSILKRFQFEPLLCRAEADPEPVQFCGVPKAYREHLYDAAAVVVAAAEYGHVIPNTLHWPASAFRERA